MVPSPNLLESRTARFGPSGNPLDLLTQLCCRMLRASATAEFSAFAEGPDQGNSASAAIGPDRRWPSFTWGVGESTIKKHSRMLHKEGRVLEQCPMARFWIDDELRTECAAPGQRRTWSVA